MKVLVVSHEWEAASPGGAQRAAAALAAGLARSRPTEVTLASAVQEVPKHWARDQARRSGRYVERLVRSRTDTAAFRWSDPTMATEWARLLADVRPDVVHLHHYFQVGADLPLLVRRVLPDAAIVLTLHEYMAICLRSGQMVDGEQNLCLTSGVSRCARCVGWNESTVAARSDYVRRGLSDVDLFITPSRFARDRYRDWGLGSADGRDLVVIPNALTIDRRRSPVAGRRSRGLRLVFIGQHTPYKGLPVLLAAMRLLDQSAPDVIDRLDVYGDGSDRFGADFHAGLVRALAAGAPTVRRRGRYEQGDLVGILDGADAIVVPSTWWENSPVVIEEALARRVPIICSDIGGMSEKVRDGVDGWHFPVGNAAGLAAVLQRVAGLPGIGLPGMRRPVGLDETVAAHWAAYEQARSRRSEGRRWGQAVGAT